MTDEKNLIKNALIAEDDDEDFEIFSAAINEISIAIVVTRAENGDILMNKLYELVSLPDILFLDILMPGTDGKECLKNIRSDKKFDNLPIIMFSGMDDFDSIEFCFRQRSNFFLRKPATLKELVENLEHLFRINWKNAYYPPISQYVLPLKQS